MSTKSAAAAAMFSKGFNCAQSVVSAFGEELGMAADTALRLACGFGAGMGRRGEVCGAVSGGILVVGATCGRGANGSGEDTNLTYKKTRELMERFENRHGTVICRKLLGGCELTTESGRQQFVDRELKKNMCTPCVRTVVEILEEII